MAMQNPGPVTDESRPISKKRAARGKWTAQQRQEIVEASLVAGAVIGEVAKRFSVRVPLISGWRRRHLRNGAAAASINGAPHFAAVHVGQAKTDGVIEIDLQTRCVRVSGIVDAAMLREVLAATR